MNKTELSPQEIEYLRSHLGKCKNQEIMSHLHCTLYMFYRYLAKYVPERSTRRKKVTHEDELYIKAHYADFTNMEIRHHTGLSCTCINRVAKKLGVKKNFDYGERARNAYKAIRKLEEGKNILPCSGRFCYRKTDCQHHAVWLEMGKPVYGCLLNGYTTKCINGSNFTYFVLK